VGGDALTTAMPVRSATVRSRPGPAGVPVLRLKKPDRSRWDDRKLDHVRPHLDRAAREGRFGVVAIVVAREFQW
jgi:predicted RNA polymerase sigma factor